MLSVIFTNAQNPLEWTLKTQSAPNNWTSVTYGNGVFVAVAYSTLGSNNANYSNRIMTSPDGDTWTTSAAPAGTNNNWYGVVYGNNQFVAVANSAASATSSVMTSPDGITWTARTAPIKLWSSVTYGNGMYVAVGYAADALMTSPDGVNWTLRTTPTGGQLWISVTYGNGLFVAVAYGDAASGSSTQRVMTSPDGINWTTRTPAAANVWIGVTYGNGLFVAVAKSGSGNRVMTSSDGINWTSRTSPADNDWSSVVYGDNQFVAVANSGTGNRVMTSPDGINWTIGTSASDNPWSSVTYANGKYVAVSSVSSTGKRVMVSGTFSVLPVKLLSFTGNASNGSNQLQWATANESNNKQFDIERSSDGINFTAIGTVVAAGNSSTTKYYSYTDNKPLSAINYYRLKQLDNNGNFEYSKIVVLKNTANDMVSIFPNPAIDVVTLTSGNTYLNTIAKLYSVEGKLLQKITIKSNQQPVNVAALAKGIYVLKFNDNTTLKLVK
ncbi:MAG: T9SS type A sorting domain-containing protein [Ferruginibacter sp.]